MRAVDQAGLRGERLLREAVGEFLAARLDRSLTQDDVARAVGVSRSELSRIERGLIVNVPVPLLARMHAAVGLELAVRSYPGSFVMRDAAHAALLERLHGRLHHTLRWRTEVPLPIPGDLRAWDAMILAPDWRMGVEAEMAPRDIQALDRRLSLKQRDANVAEIVLLLPPTRHNRSLLRAHGEILSQRFPIPGGRALELLGAGAPPGGSAMIVL